MVMRPSLLIAALAVVLAAVVSVSPSAYGELMRVELGSSTRTGVPATFDELRTRVEASEWPVSWVDEPYHDPYFSGSGGATSGTFALLLSPSATVTVTWSEFDDVRAAAAHEVEMISAYGAASYLRVRRAGRIVLQAYSQNGDPAEAAAVLERLGG